MGQVLFKRLRLERKQRRRGQKGGDALAEPQQSAGAVIHDEQCPLGIQQQDPHIVGILRGRCRYSHG